MALKKAESNNSSPTTKSTASTSTTTTRKSVGASSSPSKRGSRIGGMSPTKSPKKTGTAVVASSLSGILGLMMDKICPNNLAASEGLGADNMTGVLIEFNKPSAD